MQTIFGWGWGCFFSCFGISPKYACAAANG